MTFNSTSKSDIQNLVKKLWSSNDSERELAKMQLSELGPDAIPPLLTLLLDLANNPYPRFPIGKEKEGETAVRTFLDLLTQIDLLNFDLLNQDAIISAKLETTRKIIKELVINHRLAMDTIFLLGRLKAGEAVPFLIELMENLAMPRGYSYTDEMIALESIGSASIPCLVKAITKAENRVRSKSIKQINFHHQLSRAQLDEKLIDSVRHLLFELADDDHLVESEDEIQQMTYKIQYRALRVLRRLKAHQAIPDLEKILRETTDEDLKSLIEKAITRIRSPLPDDDFGQFIRVKTK